MENTPTLVYPIDIPAQRPSLTLLVSEEAYEGDWLNGEKHGQGTYYYSYGDVYTGNWKDGEKSGDGVLKYLNGANYTGKWKNNKAHGKGEMTFNNGDGFSGLWKDGMKNGFGIYIYKQGAKVVVIRGSVGNFLNRNGQLSP